MITFSQHWQRIDWNAASMRIHSQSKLDVERALAASSIGPKEMMALLSPVASVYLEPIAQRARHLTRQRFGNTVSFYLPLYLSNLCANECSYCGFSISNRIRRKILNEQEIIEECEAIRAQNIDYLLLVTGEHKNKVGMDYFRNCVPKVSDYFSSLIMEVQPLLQQEYAELKMLGLDGILVYQETYHLPTYHLHHLRGKKRDFFWRLETPDRVACAGIDKIGLGALIGLSKDWRTDCYMMARHLLYLRNSYWRSNYSLSFPRLRPCAGRGVTPASFIDEAELLQVMCAFRLLAPEVEISLSTRESPYFRDNVVPIVVNSVSAGSKTKPGGYAREQQELEQFLPHDNRSLQDVAQAFIRAGLQPIWKDGLKCLSVDSQAEQNNR
ncbi:2-iminoacetate synthase ThiH [Candidatus Palibaumannia cicadellinicola]|uniref:2-iminoacetate synthase ThiH n=1 Tax=Candidatus Palibaumannia cicadellinicola TaxID=186490 RepID=A0A2N4XX47_9GAMM|nr:2-iminoacetate synthase ThiH [Candidatus Baumannia cicadellinicola]PLK58848.1 2-iminoacetate synthase ThiH [Candidatus Baumannia cicadellinicola]